MDTNPGPSLRRFRDRFLIAFPILALVLLAVIFFFPPSRTPEGDPSVLGIVVGVLLLVCILTIPLLFLGKGLAALISTRVRQDMRAHPRREVLWAITTLLIIMSCLATGHGDPNSRGMRTARTENELNQIYTGILAYKAEYGELPRTSGNLELIKILEGDNPRKIQFIVLKRWELDTRNEATDAGGTPIRIAFTAPDGVSVQSPGADKIWGTPDDLTGASQ